MCERISCIAPEGEVWVSWNPRDCCSSSWFVLHLRQLEPQRLLQLLVCPPPPPAGTPETAAAPGLSSTSASWNPRDCCSSSWFVLHIRQMQQGRRLQLFVCPPPTPDPTRELGWRRIQAQRGGERMSAAWGGEARSREEVYECRLLGVEDTPKASCEAETPLIHSQMFATLYIRLIEIGMFTIRNV